MEPVVGVFASRQKAEEASEYLRNAGLRDLTLLTPDESNKEVERDVPAQDMERGGVGRAIGGVVGGAVGMAGGTQLGAAVALLIPGVGSILGFGLLGAAVLGAGGVAAGIAAGRAVETSFGDGLPKDDLFLYEDALRAGRSVLIAWAADDSAAVDARETMLRFGAESLDTARHRWWMGLRGVENEHYSANGHDFGVDEDCYRRGFQAALHAELRGKAYEDSIGRLRELFPHDCDEVSFRRGYERGFNYDRERRKTLPS